MAAPTEVVTGFPEALSAIVLRALEKDPADRYQTAEDLRIALEGWLAASGSSVSEREIAAVVKATLGAEIEDKSKKINEASAKLKELPPEELGSQDAENSQAPAPDTGSRTGSSRRREGAITEDRGVATGNIREKSSWWLPVGAGLAVLGVVVVLAKGSLGPTPIPPAPLASTLTMPAPIVLTAPNIPSEPAPRTSVPEPATTGDAHAVKITVRTIPANTTIRIDDGNAVSAPYSVELPPSAELRTITASAPNYQSVTRQVSFDQTREIVLELDRLQRQGRRHKTNAEPSPAAREPEVAQDPAPKPREPVGQGKRPRALDEDNPFSG